MIPVDLNRLREALKTLADGGDALRNVDIEATIVVVREAQAVLDAPTVFWCVVKEGPIVQTTTSLHRRLRQTGDHSGCHFVNLVPVKGADHET